ncbi:MAG: class I SAM-dependent methyltransferase family protein [Candidatus Altiarchaeota archaeon]
MSDLYLKIDSREGALIKEKLIKLGIFDRLRKIQRPKEGVLIIPITRPITIENTEVISAPGESITPKPKSHREALEGKLSDDEAGLVPKSYDLIGDIAIVEIPEGLEEKKKEIGQSFLDTFPNIKVVAAKTAPVGSEYRTRGVKVIAGENRLDTVHREYGCRYRLDVSKAYFSPRLGTERMRVAKQVKKGERILVLFAGIGPYAILIAKMAKPSEVVAVELNPDAVEYLRQNIGLNHVDVKAIEGDARIVTSELGLFDRILMPLPKDAGSFLESVLSAVKPGGFVHYYDFSSSTEESKKKVAEFTKQIGYEIKIHSAVECGSYSPVLSRICVDFQVLKRED